jgi:hypothetical protein
MKNASIQRLFGRRAATVVRRVAVMAALLGFVGGVVGVPLPKLRLAKDRSKPFPCQDHRCGCASAEQCWRSCCCFTNLQKVAWAAEHGVQPPEYVYLAAAREQAETRQAGCCRHGTNAGHNHDQGCRDEAASHEIAALNSHDHEEQTATASGASWSIDFVSAIEARKCQGQAELWLTLGAVAPPPVKIEVNLQPLFAGMVFCRVNSLAGISDAPAAPPPRV